MQASQLQNRFEKIRSNKAFELFVIGVILFSALLVGAKTYDMPSTVNQITNLLDWFISALLDFFKSFWNWFDTIIVLVSLLPLENSDTALIARLVRVFRVLRMISIIPELRILLVSLMKALPQLGYVMLLMFIIFYIYAAIGSTLFEQINPVLWGDITISLLTLFRVMTFEDWTDVMYETMKVYPLSWFYYLSFIFFTAFAFLNMVIGIVVNVMEEENAKAWREAHKDEPTLKDIAQQLAALEHKIDEMSKSKK